VDGRNPAPVDRWFIPLFIGFQPSKVVQDFLHPPYQHHMSARGIIKPFFGFWSPVSSFYASFCRIQGWVPKSLEEKQE
jgi:hypothetical protein